MPTDLVIPEVGESITEVEIGQIMAPQGTTVSKDDPILEIETDKVTLELPAPIAGVISELSVKQGDSARVGDVIGRMTEGQGQSQADGGSASESAGQTSEASASTSASRAGAGDADTAGSGRASSGAATADAGDDRDNGKTAKGDEPGHVMPAARRLLDEHGLKASDVPASGPGGRLLKEDVQSYLDRDKSGASGGKSSTSAGDGDAQRQITVDAPVAGAGPTSSNGAAGRDRREEQRVRMTPLRRRIAHNLVQAQQHAALLTTFNEVDMSAVMELRKKYQDDFTRKYDVKLGFMSFFVKAAIEALKACPALNAEIQGEHGEEEIVYKNYFDIGIAVGGGKGLVVPVIRNAESMSFAQIEQTIADLGKRARENKLELHELQGGTFTITNGGIYGSMMSTPIINPPQAGVLGMHNIVKRAVVNPQTDAIEARPMMYLALTYDHRLVDGREAVTCLVRIKQAIEDPTRMLMEV